MVRQRTLIEQQSFIVFGNKALHMTDDVTGERRK